MRRVRAALPLLLPLLALPAASGAQLPGSSTIGGDRVYRAVADSAVVTVTITPAGTAEVLAETPAGRFTVGTDTLTLDTWAVTARRLAPPGTDSAGAPAYRGVAMRDAERGTSMSLARLSAEERGEYQLGVGEGDRRAVVRLRPAEWGSLYLALLGIRPDSSTSRIMGEPVLYEFQVTAPATHVPGTNPAPRYPEALQLAGRRGRVIMQVVAGRDGRPDMKTFKVLDSTDPAFTTAVRDALARWRFVPAELYGEPVAQLVQLPFEFDIGR